MIRPQRITLYVLRELLGPTLLGFLLYTFVLLMNHFFIVAEQALSKNLDLDVTLRLFLMGVPNLMVMTIPMSVLLGTLIGVGRLSADHEWIALQSAGHGPGKLLKPVLIHGLLASLLAYYVYAEVSPKSNYALRNLRGEVIFASNLAADLRPRVFYTSLPNVVLFVEEIRAGSEGRLERVLLIQSDPESGSTELFLARLGDLYPASDGSGALILDLYDGEAHFYQSDSPESYRVVPAFGKISKRFDPASYLQALLEPPDKGVQDLSPAELLEELRISRAEERKFKESPVGPTASKAAIFFLEHRVHRAVIEMQQRLALPITSLCFAILALPLGVTRVRSGKGAGFALSIFVILIYWVAFTLARDQALSGNFPAFLGPWMGNLVILPWALIALRRMQRPRGGGGGLLASLAGVLLRAGAALGRIVTRRKRNGWSPSRVDGISNLGGTSTRFIGRLDRYIGLHYLRVLIFALVSAYVVYALVESKNLMDGILRNQLPMSMLLSYFKYFSPGVLRVVLPISCLVGAVVAFSQLSRTGELTAIKANGVSMRRATVSVLLLTLLSCAVVFVIEDRIAPGANRKAAEIKDQILGRAPRTYGTPLSGRWAFGPQGERLYNYRFYDVDRQTFQGLNVFTIDRSAMRITDHRFGERAHWLGQSWEVENGWYRTFPRDPSKTEFSPEVESILLPLDSPTNFASKQELSIASAVNLPDQMSMIELDRQMKVLGESGYDITRLRVAYHGKFSQALTPLVMVILGLPFAFRVGRYGSLYGIGVALLLVLVYWATFAIFNALGLETLLDPRVAAWGPNVLFALLGSYLMLFVRT